MPNTLGAFQLLSIYASLVVQFDATNAFGPVEPIHLKCDVGQDSLPCVYCVNADNNGITTDEVDAYVQALNERVHLIPTNDSGIHSTDFLKASHTGGWWLTGVDGQSQNASSHDVCGRFAQFFSTAVAAAGGDDHAFSCVNAGTDIYGSSDVDSTYHIVMWLHLGAD